GNEAGRPGVVFRPARCRLARLLHDLGGLSGEPSVPTCNCRRDRGSRGRSRPPAPDTHNVAAGKGTSNDKPTLWTVPGQRHPSRLLTAWPPATWSRGAGRRPTHARGNRRPRLPAGPGRQLTPLPARPPLLAPVHAARPR